MVLLSVKERILTIQLMNKIARHPTYAKALGLEGVSKVIKSDDFEDESEKE